MQLQQRVELFRQIISTTQCTDHARQGMELEHGMSQAMQWLQAAKHQQAMVYIIGNGGSAAVASHALIDFLNVAKLRAQVLHEPSIMTCMANDYGYENAYSRLLSLMLKPKDILIAISSSGRSSNICQAVTTAKALQASVITFSGFQTDNPLRQLGDLNFWLNSADYGFVEVGHQFILHNLSDRFGVLEAPNAAVG